ncbi:RNA polymerase sigma-70 factor, ECF subfamily [bacterium A37T11]|nr:RNA polymerase sigma-70 factor, ECF subfamily [bacterium A37T11]
MNQVSDHLLLQQLAAGSEAAFSQIYAQHWDSVFKLVKRILPNEDEVADVVQETFILLWEQRAKMERVVSIKSYLIVIARNKAFKVFQSRLKQTDYLEKMAGFYSEAIDETEQAILSKNLEAMLEAEIQKMPPRMQEIFILSRREHLSYKEIAERLQISDLTVKKQINKSLNYLRLKIDEDYLPYLILFLLYSFFL